MEYPVFFLASPFLVLIPQEPWPHLPPPDTQIRPVLLCLAWTAHPLQGVLASPLLFQGVSIWQLSAPCNTCTEMQIRVHLGLCYLCSSVVWLTRLTFFCVNKSRPTLFFIMNIREEATVVCLYHNYLTSHLLWTLKYVKNILIHTT